MFNLLLLLFLISYFSAAWQQMDHNALDLQVCFTVQGQFTQITSMQLENVFVYPVQI